MKLARLLDLPEIVRAKALTSLYRKAGYLHPSARIAEGGCILDPAKRMAVRVGHDTVLRGELFIFPHGGKISIGSWSFIGKGSYIWSSESITIGDRVLISHGVNIHHTNGHPINPRDRHEQFRAIATTGHPASIQGMKAAPVVIEDDVWIGFGVTILKGVTIGARSIIGAGSVVLDDVPPDSRIGGNPARALGAHDVNGDIRDWPQYAD